ncbi:YMR185W [Zygosaccharomyces parabailii]|nr:YMR185W [Zygosaccharomyces parabailii]CDH12858.1 uncharacterized protein ZBAI_04644 [Zygosaccharomyces bailii ISA1307]
MSVSDILKYPQYVGSTPLDNFFQDLEAKILSKTRSLKADNQRFVSQLLHYLRKLRTLTLDEQTKLNAKGSDMLPISLHDMKYVERLIALIITYGIYVNLPTDFQAPLQFSKDEVPSSYKPDLSTLELVCTMIHNILLQKNDQKDYVKSIILKGPLFTNSYLGLLTLCVEMPSAEHEKMLPELENVQQSYELFEMYTLLVQEVKNADAKARLLTQLGTLAVRRNNGVLSLIDFIMGVREDEQVDLEKMNRVAQILVAKPKSTSSIQYFSSLFPQIYDGLSMLNRPIVVSCLNNVVTTFFLKNPKIVRDFLFQKLYKVIFNEPIRDHCAKELNDTVNVLISLTKNSCNDLLQNLVEGVDKKLFYLNLWTYALFLKRRQKLNPLGQENGPYHEVILTLLKSFMVLLHDNEVLTYLSMSLLNYRHEKWEYCIDFETQLAYITVRSEQIELKVRQEWKDPLAKANEMFTSIDEAVDLFVQLLKIVNKEDMVKDVFLAVLARWIKTDRHNDTTLGDFPSSALVLLDLKILEKLHNEFTTDIVKKPTDILQLLIELIDFCSDKVTQQDSDDEEKSEKDSDDEDRSEEDAGEHKIQAQLQSGQPSALEMMIQLLKSILPMPAAKLESSKISLRIIDAKLLKQGDNSMHKAITDVIESKESVATENGADDDFLHEAMVNLGDQSAPMQVLGLTQLIKLIQKKSSVVTPATVTQWHMQFMKNTDPYIYLTAIKGLGVLCECDERTFDRLLAMYAGSKKSNSRLDDILKIGEVFINYIQQQNEMFQGPQAHKLIDTCLIKVRRRDEIDDRLRMSAISLLGIGAQTNARGIQDRIGDMLDCSFGILQMETKTKGSFVVRRAALHLIHDLLCSAATFPSQYNRAKLITLLEYTREKDEDMLVRDQAAQLLSILNSGEHSRTF